LRQRLAHLKETGCLQAHQLACAPRISSSDSLSPG
jgi:hypothetical protein